MTDLPLYLASRSPRRRALLAQLGLHPPLLDAAVDETPWPGETPADYVRRLALAKAGAGHAALPRGTPSAVVLGADTSVVVDGTILGKPRDRNEGLAMLARLAGREHQVLSAVALDDGTRRDCRVQSSQVRFRALDADERERYWASGEPADKAGGYAIQGLGAVFITELHGSYSGVMGLPLFETAELLANFGIRTL